MRSRTMHSACPEQDVDSSVMDSKLEVIWHQWDDEAFAEARGQNKPILLSVGLAWRRWFYQVANHATADELSRAAIHKNSLLADYINTHFIPIRLDDDHLAFNEHYNLSLSGYPMTYLLTPDGEVICDATYLTPEQMWQLLPSVIAAWRNGRVTSLNSTENSAREMDGEAQRGNLRSSDLRSLIVRHQSEIIKQSEVIKDVAVAIIRRLEFSLMDDERSGGQAPLMNDDWEFLLALYADTAESRLLTLGVKALSTCAVDMRDDAPIASNWSTLCLEKAIQAHARLTTARLHAIQLCRAARREEDALTLTQIVQMSLNHWTTTLLHDEADLTYFALPTRQDTEQANLLSLAEYSADAHLPSPLINRQLHVGWNALMISTLLQAGVVLDGPTYTDLATRIWRSLVSHCINDDGSVVHSLISKGGMMKHAGLRGQLINQAALARAGLDLMQHRPEMADDVLSVVRSVVAFAMRDLRAPEGNFYEGPAGTDAQDILRVRFQPLFANCAFAEALLLMGYLTDDQTARQAALESLAAFDDEYGHYHEHAASYALVVMRASRPPDEVVIVGSSNDVPPFVRAAHATYSPWRIVRVLDPGRDAPAIAQRGYPIDRLPAAFLHRKMMHGVPVYTPDALRAAPAYPISHTILRQPTSAKFSRRSL